MTAVIPAGVETARDLVGPALTAAVERLSPDVRKVAAYHLGLAGPEGRCRARPTVRGPAGTGAAGAPAAGRRARARRCGPR